MDFYKFRCSNIIDTGTFKCFLFDKLSDDRVIAREVAYLRGFAIVVLRVQQ